MKNDLLKVLNFKLKNISDNIDELKAVNESIEKEEDNLAYIKQVIDNFSATEGGFDIYKFAKLSRDDFNKLLMELDDSVLTRFGTNSCNYEGLIYLIEGINNGISLTLTQEQTDAINLLIDKLLEKEKDYRDRIESLNDNKQNLLQCICIIAQKMKTEGNNDDIAYYLDKINRHLNLKGKRCTFKNVLLLIINNLYNELLGQNGEISKSENFYLTRSEAYNHFIRNISYNDRFFELFHGIKKVEYSCTNCNTKYYRCDLFKLISINVEEKKNIYNKNHSIRNSFIGNGANENLANNWMNSPAPYFDFLDNLYDKVLKEQKKPKNYKCGNCKGNHFLKGKNLYEICPEILIINFNINFNEHNSFFVDFVLNLNMNYYIENKRSDVDYKYELSSFIEYDLKQEEYITYFKYKNKFVKMTKENTTLIDIKSFNIIKNPIILTLSSNDACVPEPTM